MLADFVKSDVTCSSFFLCSGMNIFVWIFLCSGNHIFVWFNFSICLQFGRCLSLMSKTFYTHNCTHNLAMNFLQLWYALCISAPYTYFCFFFDSDLYCKINTSVDICMQLPSSMHVRQGVWISTVPFLFWQYKKDVSAGIVCLRFLLKWSY